MGKAVNIPQSGIDSNLLEMVLLKFTEFERKVDEATLSPHSLQLFTEEETARLLCISKRTLVSLRAAGKIHYRQLESCIRYSIDDIAEYEKACRRWC